MLQLINDSMVSKGKSFNKGHWGVGKHLNCCHAKSGLGHPMPYRKDLVGLRGFHRIVLDFATLQNTKTDMAKQNVNMLWKFLGVLSTSLLLPTCVYLSLSPSLSFSLSLSLSIPLFIHAPASHATERSIQTREMETIGVIQQFFTHF